MQYRPQWDIVDVISTDSENEYFIIENFITKHTDIRDKQYSSFHQRGDQSLLLSLSLSYLLLFQ